MELITYKSNHNFYESFSDLIFNALILFIILILFLVLNVNNGATVMKQEHEAKMQEYENQIVAYKQKLQDIEDINGTAKKDSDIWRKKYIEIEEQLANKTNILMNIEFKNKELEKEVLAFRSKDAEMVAKKDIKENNAKVNVNSFVSSGGSRQPTKQVIAVKKEGDYWYISPVPVSVWERTRPMIGRSDSDIQEVADNFMVNTEWIPGKDFINLTNSIKRIKIDKLDKNAVYPQGVFYFWCSTLFYEGDIEDFKKMLEGITEIVGGVKEWTNGTCEVGETPTLYFSVKEKEFVRYPNGKTIVNGQDLSKNVKRSTTTVFVVGGLELSERMFKILLSSYGLGGINVEYRGENGETIPYHAQQVLAECGFVTNK